MKFFSLISTLDNRKDEKGFMAAEWVVGIAILVFPAFVLVLSLTQVPARKNLTQVASAAAARAYVQALDQGQAEAAARAAAADAIVAETGETPSLTNDTLVKNYLSGKNVTLEFNLVSGDGYCPGAQINVSVEAPLPVSINPFSPGDNPFPIGSLKSSATERIDDYSELAPSATEDVYDYENGTCPE